MTYVRIYGKPPHSESELELNGAVGIEDFTTQGGHPIALPHSVSVETVDALVNGRTIRIHYVTMEDGSVRHLTARWIRRIGLIVIDEDGTVRWSDEQ